MSKQEVYNVTSNNQKGGVTAGKIIDNTETKTQKTNKLKVISVITGVLMLIVTIIGLITNFYSNGK